VIEAHRHLQPRLWRAQDKHHNSLFYTTEPIMNVDTIPDFLAEKRDEAPADLASFYLEAEDLWERKLWHQLTDTLIDFFNHKQSAAQRLPFYRTFILTFADKINQLKLVTLALSAATQCKGY
jgi:26S proteasome regulatory subunit N9